MIATYYRGRTTFGELMNMPLSYINTLYTIAVERQREEQAQREKDEAEGKNPGLSPTQAMALEDELEAGL